MDSTTVDPTQQPVAAAPDVRNLPAISNQPVPVPAPTVVKPQRRGGLAGIIDEFRDAIAGTERTDLYTDAQGNKYVQHTPMSHKGQWLKIAAEGAAGAARGAAVGRGPGGVERAAAAGLEGQLKTNQQEQDREQDMDAQVRQSQLDRFNAVKLKHDMAANEFALQRMQVNASQSDIKFSQEQLDRERQLGSADLGTYKDEADLANVQKQHPEFWKDVYANNIVALPEVNQKGERIGLHVFLRTPGIGKTLVEPGTPIKMFTPGEKPNDPPTLTEQVPSIPMTHDEVDAYNNSAYAKMQQWHKDKAEIDLKASQKLKADADAAKAGRANQPKPAGDGAPAAVANLTGEEYLKTLPGDRQALLGTIHSGRIAPENLNRMLSGKEGQKLLTDLSSAYGNDIDTSKLSAYPALYKNFISGKRSREINSGATVFEHLDKLAKLNTVESHIPHTADYTAYKNQVDTLAPELAAFYGHSTNEAINSYKDTLMSQLPGNRLSAIKTQAESMGKKFDNFEQEWRNGAPSTGYQAPMPGMSDNAKQARAGLDSEYAKRLQQEKQPQRPANVPQDYIHRDGPQGVGWYKP